MLSDNNFVIRPKFQVLSKDEIEYFYSRTVEVLERVGVQVLHQESLELLRSAGAVVNTDSVVKIKPSLVEDAVQSVPKQVFIYDREGELAMELGGGNTGGFNTYYGTGSDLKYHYDPYSGEMRLTVAEDIGNMSKVTDYLTNMDFMMSYGIPSDCDLNKIYQTEFVHMVKNSTKPIIFTSDNGEGSKQIIEMAAVSVGGIERLQERPFVLNYSQPTSPLQHSDDALSKVIACAEFGIPVCYPSGLMPGATAPVTLAGAITQSLAETLSALTICQLKRRGAPMVLGGAHGCIDMRTMINVYAAPERLMTQSVIASFCQYFGIPTWGMGGISDSVTLDEQAGIEYAISNLWAALNGINIAHDIGYLASGMAGDLSAIVINDEIIDYTRHILCHGVPVDREHLAIDVMERVGHGGVFLSDKHTFDHFRTNLWSPEHSNRDNIDRWKDKDQKSMKDNTMEKVRNILEKHEPKPLDHEINKELEKMLSF